MKTLILILNLFLSFSVIAQPAVSGRTFPGADTIILLPTSSITLTGTAVQANPGHPILDTTWTQTSGPAATITNPSNRMNTTVTGLVKGSYSFMLTATDKQNSASATIKITVISGTLPIELAYFNVSKSDKGILFTWQTPMESNSARFVIQKSVNGAGFQDLAIVSSKAKEGNSSGPLTYSYLIPNGSTQAGMYNIGYIMIILAFIAVLGKLKKAYKTLVLAAFCLLLFSCTKSVTAPTVSNPPATVYRLKLVDMNNNVSYSEIRVLN